MTSILLVYSSITGNTRMVADAVMDVLPPGAVMKPVTEIPDAAGFDLVMLGFWAYRCAPNPQMLRYMSTLRNCDVAFFGTLAAYPDSAHALKVVAQAEKALQGNRLAGYFLCQGKLAPKIFERHLNAEISKSSHPMTPERMERLIEARRHPDEQDLQNARNAFLNIVSARQHYSK